MRRHFRRAAYQPKPLPMSQPGGGFRLFDLAENEPMLIRRFNVSRLTPKLLGGPPALKIVRNGQKRATTKYG
jgi:hypothetical protein